ncbi:heterokaryon incompatibility protein [Colletotrichum salicis]|uniref:Heterokaryon incompatibility protein n=1 Tax=Colletotrichum salicis TaxID=1209931 RepID=A0A135V762_9PEZI|nr:heterokaryon incompatibility protein [Colletotrichum salicis]
MADIFQNAFITLAASKAVKSSRGLYTSSLDPKHQAQALSLVNDEDDSKVMLRAYSELLHIDSFWSYFPITKRAWVFQERLLSGRVVHFAGSEVNWDCRSKRMCECGEISTSTSLPENIQFSGSLAELSGQYSSITEEQSPSAQGNGQNDDLDYSKFTPALLRSPKWTKSDKMWRQTVQSYCALNLTFSKDIFPALGGIAKLWNPEYEKLYRAGLWMDSLHLALLWLVYNPESVLMYGEPHHVHGHLLSTTTMSSSASTLIRIPEIRAVCVPAGIVDPTGELDSAHLLLSTFAISGTLVKWLGVLVEYGVSPVWLVVGNLWISQGDGNTRGLQLDAPINNTDAAWSIPIRVIRITDFGVKTSNHPEMACLIIRSKQAEITGEGVDYERLGYVRFVEQGSSQTPVIRSEHSTLEPSIEAWIKTYREHIAGIDMRELKASNLERLKD